jgi:hypothetical protein
MGTCRRPALVLVRASLSLPFPALRWRRTLMKRVLDVDRLLRQAAQLADAQP